MSVRKNGHQGDNEYREGEEKVRREGGGGKRGDLLTKQIQSKAPTRVPVKLDTQKHARDHLRGERGGGYGLRSDRTEKKERIRKAKRAPRIESMHSASWARKSISDLTLKGRGEKGETKGLLPGRNRGLMENEQQHRSGVSTGVIAKTIYNSKSTLPRR